MKPNVQLSLELDDVPAPPPQVVERLPEAAIAAAVARMGRLIVNTVGLAAASPVGLEADDE